MWRMNNIYEFIMKIYEFAILIAILIPKPCQMYMPIHRTSIISQSSDSIAFPCHSNCLIYHLINFAHTIHTVPFCLISHSNTFPISHIHGNTNLCNQSSLRGAAAAGLWRHNKGKGFLRRGGTL